MDIYTIREEIKKNNKKLSDLDLKVVYYARVSTDKDEQLHSLSAQQKHFEELVAGNSNWTLIRGYIDEGISATSVKNRDNFLRMIRDAKSHKFDLILTKEISRFARNTIDSLSYTQELLRNGVGVIFESDNINTLDPDAELRLTIMSSIAQDETRKISERVKFGFRESINKGVVLGNDCIWGYRKEQGKLVIVPEEAEMVRMIFDLYANENMGVRKIAKAITDSGYRNTNGNPFSFSSVKGILVNPKYKGYYCGHKTHKIDFRHNDVKYLPPDEWVIYKDNEKVPPIVSPELWDKANRKLKERSSKMTSENKTSYQNKYLYSGRIVCGEHGTCYHHTVYKYKSGNKELWACKEYGNGNKCRNPIIYTSELDAVMREVYNQVVCEKTTIVSELIELYKENGSEKAIAKSKHKIISDINAVIAKKDKLLDLSLDNRLSNEEFEQRNNSFNKQIEKLKSELTRLDKEEQKKINIKESIENLRSAISDELDFSDELGKNVIDSFIDKIVVYKSDVPNRIDLKIFLKLMPKNIPWQKDSLPHNEHRLLLSSGSIAQTRGGNSRSVKEYELIFNYDLCYSV
ncbi:MAG: recombinase family protein [Clostridia bacterium]|nr:recombinase family protein [Clostridia bacterium]